MVVGLFNENGLGGISTLLQPLALASHSFSTFFLIFSAFAPFGSKHHYHHLDESVVRGYPTSSRRNMIDGGLLRNMTSDAGAHAAASQKSVHTTDLTQNRHQDTKRMQIYQQSVIRELFTHVFVEHGFLAHKALKLSLLIDGGLY